MANMALVSWDPFGIFQKQVYEANKSLDKTRSNISAGLMWNISSPGAILWAQINQLEGVNLMIDAVALGDQALSTLGYIPGLDIDPPPGMELTEGAGIEYYEGVRDEINEQIDELIQQLAVLQKSPQLTN